MLAMPSWKLILLLVSAPLHLSSCCSPSDHSFPGPCTVLFLLLDSRESYFLRPCPQCSVSVICTEGLVSLSKFVHLEKVRATIGTQEFCLQSPCSSHFILAMFAVCRIFLPDQGSNPASYSENNKS